MFTLIVISVLTMTGPWGMKASGGMNGFYIRDMSERACQEAKKEIVEEARKLLTEEKLIVRCIRQ